MSLEAIEKVTQAETECRERRAAAEAEARQLEEAAEFIVGRVVKH